MPDEGLRHTYPLLEIAENDSVQVSSRIVVKIELHLLGVQDSFMETNDPRMIMKDIPQEFDFERFPNTLWPLLNLADAQCHIGSLL